MARYYLHLGSNIGDRKNMIEDTVEKIEDTIGKILIKSTLYETQPWGLKDQNDFLNMALLVESEALPNIVMNKLEAIQDEIGAQKEVIWGPRKIDIDILYCDNLVVNSEKLTIPHPRLYERNFVLIPLMEIAADHVDPVKLITVEGLYDQCKDDCEVWIFEE